MTKPEKTKDELINELEESEERFRNLLENLEAGIVVHAPDTSVVMNNQRATELLGLSDHQMRGKVAIDPSWKFINEDYTPLSIDGYPFQRIMNRRAPIRNQIVGISHPGKDYIVWVTANGFPVFNDKGEVTEIVISFIDISRNKVAEETIRKNETIQRKMVSNIGDVIVIIDQNGINRYKSPNIKAQFGWDPEELIGQITWDNVYPGDLGHAREFLSAIAMEPNASGTTEIRYKQKDGKYVWIEITLVNLLSDPDINGLLGNYHNITSRKQGEKELIIAKERAEESDRLKSAFLANMSHEIRTPMNGILGFADLLKEPGLSSQEQQNYIRIIEKSGTRMLNTINDIVDISKIESGLINLEIKESNINEQIEYIYTFFKPEVEAKGMKLSFRNSLPAKKAIIKTDQEKLYAILTNLVKNAIKYTEKGFIEFGYELVKQVHEQTLLKFYVKDTGIGVPKDRVDAIFERFIQADIDNKTARQGSGLGLAIAKSYVEMLGGKIWLESEEDIGSTFCFTLPYVTEKTEIRTINNASPAEGTDNQSYPGLTGCKILVVEDDETSEMYITILAKGFCKEILTARSGPEAIEICIHNPGLDLILMDIQMPVMSGYEATRQIRQFNKEVAIIAQTAYGLSGDREKAIEAGFNDYISKPIKKDEFIAMIQKYLKK